MTWVFFDVAAIEHLHADLIRKYGGSHGLRDAGLLASAVTRAENKVTFDPEATVPTVAASLSFGLIKKTMRSSMATSGSGLRLWWISSR